MEIITSSLQSQQKYTSSQFWDRFKNEIPRIRQLDLVLSNTPASAASIERFFSVCGFVCDKRRGNMNDELKIVRSMLKSNVRLLDDMEVKQ